MHEICRMCGATLRRPATGRPPSYCGTPCRRAAELAIKRQDRRIERLMVQVEAQRLRIPRIDHVYSNHTTEEPGPPRDAREHLAHLERLITEAEVAMRRLMGEDG